MIKAIIALINKWAYRCEHEWVEIYNVDLIRTDQTIESHLFVYRCKKCCDVKQFKIK